jgi:hypothetical protein
MFRSFEKIHLIGGRTSDLPACSIVPQPTTLLRAKIRVCCTEILKLSSLKSQMSTCYRNSFTFHQRDTDILYSPEYPHFSFTFCYSSLCFRFCNTVSQNQLPHSQVPGQKFDDVLPGQRSWGTRVAVKYERDTTLEWWLAAWNLRNSNKNLLQHSFFQHESHMKSLGIEPGSLRRQIVHQQKNCYNISDVTKNISSSFQYHLLQRPGWLNR